MRKHDSEVRRSDAGEGMRGGGSGKAGVRSMHGRTRNEEGVDDCMKDLSLPSTGQWVSAE